MIAKPVLIKGGTVFDGVCPEGVVRDVLLTDGRVAAVGTHIEVGPARVVDASGAWVMPGFVDAHSHCDMSAMDGSAMELRARGGVTTEVVGQDGIGFFPANRRAGDVMAEVLAPIVDELPQQPWATVAAYLDDVDRGAYARVAALVPHGVLRAQLAGRSERALDESETAQMARLVHEGSTEGAVGLSTGLSYPPALWASTDEVAAAAAALPTWAPYVTHLRDYGSTFDAALDEALSIGRLSGRSVHLSHFHVSGIGRGGKAPAYLERLERTRSQGLSISWDSYPYLHACTFLTAVLPTSLQRLTMRELLCKLQSSDSAGVVAAEIDAAGPGATVAAGWDGLFLAGLADTPLDCWAEQSVAQVAAATGRSPGQVVVDVIDRLRGHACVLVEQGHRDNALAIASHPAQMGGSDGIPGCGAPHPRISGSFLRLLRWARDGLLAATVGETVRKLTSAPADLFRLPVGRLRDGAPADALVIDPERLADGPDIGQFMPDAIRFSFLAGTAVIDDGTWQAPRPEGLALRGPKC